MMRQQQIGRAEIDIREPAPRPVGAGDRLSDHPLCEQLGVRPKLRPGAGVQEARRPAILAFLILLSVAAIVIGEQLEPRAARLDRRLAIPADAPVDLSEGLGARRLVPEQHAPASGAFGKRELAKDCRLRIVQRPAAIGKQRPGGVVAGEACERERDAAVANVARDRPLEPQQQHLFADPAVRRGRRDRSRNAPRRPVMLQRDRREEHASARTEAGRGFGCRLPADIGLDEVDWVVLIGRGLDVEMRLQRPADIGRDQQRRLGHPEARRRIAVAAVERLAEAAAAPALLAVGERRAHVDLPPDRPRRLGIARVQRRTRASRAYPDDEPEPPHGEPGASSLR